MQRNQNTNKKFIKKKKKNYQNKFIKIKKKTNKQP